MDPINYSIDVDSPFRSALAGVQAGLAIRNQDNVDAESDAKAKAAKVEADILRQRQIDLEELAANENPTIEDYNRVAVRNPDIAEAIMKSWSALDSDNQRSRFNTLLETYSALYGDDVDTAEAVLQEQETAYRNAGDTRSAAGVEAMRRMVRLNPRNVIDRIGMLLANAPGDNGKQFGAALGQLGAEFRAQQNQPATKRKLEADADIAEIDAANRETKNALDNEATMETILTAQQSRRLAELDAELKVAASEMEREKLEMERAKILEAKGKPQDQLDTLSIALDSVNQALNHEGLWSGSGLAGDFAAWFNGSDAADFRATLDPIRSQQFLTNIQTLRSAAGSPGAISDADAKRLESTIASLSTTQSAAQMRRSLGIIKSVLNRAYSAQLQRPGVAAPGRGAPVARSPTHGMVYEGDVNGIMRKFPGATREEVINYLRSQPWTPE